MSLIKYKKIISLSGFLVIGLMMGCQHHHQLGPTLPTEADLVANSIGNGLSKELAIPYEQAYKNLAIAYNQCMAFTSEHGFVFTDHKFEPDLEMATLFARSKGGVFLFKTTVEAIDANTTTMTLYLPKGYKFAKARFKQDVLMALGKDSQCQIKSNEKDVS